MVEEQTAEETVLIQSSNHDGITAETSPSRSHWQVETKRLTRITGHQENVQRAIVAHEMKHEIIVCPLEDWLEAYQPFKPSEAEIVSGVSILSQSLTAPDGSQEAPLLGDRGWKHFPQRPSTLKQSENVVFAPLREISETIGTINLDSACQLYKRAGSSEPTVPAGGTHVASQSDSSIVRRSPTVEWNYTTEPSKAIPGEQEGSNNEVDGFFHRLIPELGTISLGDVSSVVCEYKKFKGAEAVSKNRTQVVGAACSLFNQDPRRVAVYGMTIEDEEVRLWYFSRSHSAVSEPFDFLSRSSMFVRVLLMFMFATEVSVGFDPNLKRIPPPPGDKTALISYVYRLADTEHGKQWERVYRTQETLCDCHRLCITGRGTRAWKAHRVKSFEDLERQHDKTVVIREVWLDVGAKTEKGVQEAIFGDLERFGQQLAVDPDPPHFQRLSAELRKEVEALLQEDESIPAYVTAGGRARVKRKGYEKYFLTILCDSLGTRSRDTAKTYSLAPDLLRLHSSAQKKRHSSVEGADSSRNNYPSVTEATDWSVPDVSPDSPPPQVPRKYRAKQRYFLAYEECCLDLDHRDVTTLREIFIGLKGCLMALLLMFCAGWVHRDVSCANVLIWKNREGQSHGKLGDLEYAKKFPSLGSSPDPKTGTAFFLPAEIGQREYLKPPLAEGSAKKKPRLSPDSAEEGERNARQPNAVVNTPERDPVQHHFTHDLETLWWVAIWAVTLRIGWRTPVRQVFIPYIGEAAESRMSYICHFRQLEHLRKDQAPIAISEIYPKLETARAYFADSYLEWAAQGDPDAKRKDPAAHSGGYGVLLDVVSHAFPPDAPALVTPERNPSHQNVTVAHTAAKRLHSE